MPTRLMVESTVREENEWENIAKRLFSCGAVGIMELKDGRHSIFARVTGFVEDPTYGRLIQIERIRDEDAKNVDLDGNETPS